MYLDNGRCMDLHLPHGSGVAGCMACENEAELGIAAIRCLGAESLFIATMLRSLAVVVTGQIRSLGPLSPPDLQFFLAAAKPGRKPQGSRNAA